jgi:ADP-ribosylglycohydrolase
MIGAISGDVIGSVHEGAPPTAKDFPLLVARSRFTDDTVLTVAVANAIREGGDFAASIRRWGRRYPDAGYGGWFQDWLFREDAAPYYSFGNGSAMRVAAVGWAFDDLDVVLSQATKSAEVTHNHPEGIKGAQAVAAAVLLGRRGRSKDEIAALLSDRFGYDCSVGLAALQRRGGFDVTCQGTVPAAAVAFLESTDFEDAVRNAVSFGGDADTLACIAGAMAEAHYGRVPAGIQAEVFCRLDDPLRAEVRAFAQAYGVRWPARTAECDPPVGEILLRGDEPACGGSDRRPVGDRVGSTCSEARGDGTRFLSIGCPRRTPCARNVSAKRPPGLLPESRRTSGGVRRVWAVLLRSLEARAVPVYRPSLAPARNHGRVRG